MPPITFPESLPVSGRRDEIAQALQAHQVVIVCGETGSGKTTQLPKICLELGRGVTGLIGHTQPRRIAARATASRIAQELKTELGGVVVIEAVFGWLGVGLQAWTTIRNQDTPMIMGTVLFASVFVVFINLLVDMLYMWLDPRVRLV